MLFRGSHYFFFQCHKLPVHRAKIDFFLLHGGADIAGEIQVVTFRLDPLHGHPLGITLLLLAKLVGIDDLPLCQDRCRLYNAAW